MTFGQLEEHLQKVYTDKKALLDGYKEIMAREPVSTSFLSRPEANSNKERLPIFGVLNDPDYEVEEEEKVEAATTINVIQFER